MSDYQEIRNYFKEVKEMYKKHYEIYYEAKKVWESFLEGFSRGYINIMRFNVRFFWLAKFQLLKTTIPNSFSHCYKIMGGGVCS
ncbi:hypothetical protein [endosymbiont GvMRE of Glomus versiforme]|uniref:hypothetical protein n=1 Tax=endosymbiont GvMRE of Glomus versiforme TaxID=2039283 RepID=UPI000EE73F45|nr:hypothetical protein [endosymbiont GvMRE of Glomus versiforme]RHZ37792.1 hypothetical protein GvMRE_I1g257 [endosymbiont GvMRE of Glomus versiforme]